MTTNPAITLEFPCQSCQQPIADGEGILLFDRDWLDFYNHAQGLLRRGVRDPQLREQLEGVERPGVAAYHLDHEPTPKALGGCYVESIRTPADFKQNLFSLHD